MAIPENKVVKREERREEEGRRMRTRLTGAESYRTLAAEIVGRGDAVFSNSRRSCMGSRYRAIAGALIWYLGRCLATATFGKVLIVDRSAKKG